MTRSIASLVCGLSVVLCSAAAHAQDLQPPPPMGAPGSGGGQSPPGYPGAPGQPSSSSMGTTSEPPPTDESEDSGLGLEWVYLNADAGYAYADMTSFNASTLGLQKTASGGPVFGAAAGVRLLFFTIGARVRDLILSDIGSLWELSGEAAFHIRVWHIDPYFGVRGGYNFVGSLSGSTVTVAAGDTSNVSVHGFNVGPMVGIDVYLNKYFSIGADVDAQFLFIQRPKLALPAGITQQDVAMLPPQQQQLYNESGSSAGIAVAPTAHLGLHF